MRRFLPILFAVSLFGVEPSNELVNAVKQGDVKSLKELVKTKETANAALPNGKSVLMLSIWEGKTDITALLLERGANINAVDNGGKTALMLAVWKENLPLVKFLIQKGADVNAKNSDGLTAADVAELSGNGDMIDYFKTR